MDLLDEIVALKKEEVQAHRSSMSIELLGLLPLYQEPRRSLVQTTTGKSGPMLIAEFKRCSPSRPSFHYAHQLENVAVAYKQGGASAISVLTDRPFFGGSLEDLYVARIRSELPVLRKDFIIDSYQIHEARAFGADLILLIVRILSDAQLVELNDLALALGLETLVEVHDAREIERCHICGVRPSFFGINNRSLSTLTVDTSTSAQLLNALPTGIPAIAESGLGSYQEIQALSTLGFLGFLVGTHLLDQSNPELACKQLLGSKPCAN